MSDFGEAMGSTVEGGLLARAIGGDSDGETAALDNSHFAEGHCLNCGTELIGPHCHACGQQAHLHRTLGAFMHDLLHGALHFEGRTWATLPKLFFKPGELTRRYIDGERRRFVSPMALFLFSIFLMFAVFQAVGLTTPTEVRPGQIVSNLDETRAAAKTEIEEAKAQLARLPGDDPRRAAIERELAENTETLDTLDQLEALGSGESETGNISVNVTGIEGIDQGLVRKWTQHPELMLYKLQSNSYKFSWLLIPLSIPFMWLLFFWKRRFRAYDHAIFVTYSLAFMSLLFVIGSVIVTLAGGLQGWASLLAVIPPIHIYKQLRGTYGLSRFGAFWRLCVLTVFIAIVLTLFLQLLLVLGAF